MPIKPSYDENDYIQGMLSRAEKLSNYGKTAGTNLGQVTIGYAALIALSPYFYTSTNGKKYAENYAVNKVHPNKSLVNLPLSNVINPYKLLNPFKAVEMISRFMEIGIGILIDKVAGESAGRRESHPVAKAIKYVAMIPFAAINLIISPLSTIEKTAPFQKLAEILGIKGPSLGGKPSSNRKFSKSEESSTSEFSDAASNTPLLKQTTHVNSHAEKAVHNSQASLMKTFNLARNVKTLLPKNDPSTVYKIPESELQSAAPAAKLQAEDSQQKALEKTQRGAENSESDEKGKRPFFRR